MVGNAGLGWSMAYQRAVLDIPGLYASIIIIIIIGLVMDGFFGVLEKITVKRWGMVQ
jgi:NitT/TauT family transport system permease protein